MKIYISGKITGLPLEEAKANFKKVEKGLQRQGYLAINPMELVPYHPDKNWNDYMVDDIALLLTCDTIYMMDNYKESKGAKLELAIAKELGLKVIYEMNF